MNLGVDVNEITVSPTQTTTYTVTVTNSVGYTSTDEAVVVVNASGLYDVYDIDGNGYDTIRFGAQTWMTRNLAVTRYNDGTSILGITNYTEWVNNSIGAYCFYNNEV